MSLVDQMALLPDEIDRESLKMVEESISSSLKMTVQEKYVLFRIVRAEGDPNIVDSVKFSPDAVEAGLSALRLKNPVITDVRMVQVGISKALLAGNQIETHCLIDVKETAEKAKLDGTTRSVAAMRGLERHIDGAIVAIGNAPTALLALIDMIDEHKVKPALVIGMPVGFVACAESKDELVKRSIPYMTITGNRGGSSAAAATVNALLDLLKSN